MLSRSPTSSSSPKSVTAICLIISLSTHTATTKNVGGTCDLNLWVDTTPRPSFRPRQLVKCCQILSIFINILINGIHSLSFLLERNDFDWLAGRSENVSDALFNSLDTVKRRWKGIHPIRSFGLKRGGYPAPCLVVSIHQRWKMCSATAGVGSFWCGARPCQRSEERRFTCVPALSIDWSRHLTTSSITLFWLVSTYCFGWQPTKSRQSWYSLANYAKQLHNNKQPSLKSFDVLWAHQHRQFHLIDSFLNSLKSSSKK